MASPDNPFSPNFGSAPHYLAGRAEVLKSVQDVTLNLARVDYSRTSLIIGQRGTGKTVLLNRIQEMAEAEGWVVIRVVAGRGFLRRLLNSQLPQVRAELRPPRDVTASVTLGGGPVPASVTVSEQPHGTAEPTLDGYIAEICAALGPTRGLLFAVDEVNSATRAELEEFAAAYQTAVGNNRLNAGLVLCGVQSGLRKMLSGQSAVSFLARSRRLDIGILSYPVAIEAFQQTLAVRGTRTADDDALVAMAALSKGYPYLIQEVGYLAWDVRPDADSISVDDVRAIAPQAIAAMNTSVLSVIVRDIRGRYRRALGLIASNPGIRTTELAARLEIPATAMGDVHQRLLEAGLVVRDPNRTGVVRIAVPYLADYLATDDRPHADETAQLAALESFPDFPGPGRDTGR